MSRPNTQNHPGGIPPTGSQPPTDGRGFFRSRKFLGLIAGLVALSFAGLIYSLYALVEAPATERLESAFDILKRGDSETAALIAQAMVDDDLSKPELSQKHLLLGIQARQEASQSELRSRAFEMMEQSIEHLQKSQTNRFPSGYEGLGNYHLGMALYDLQRWKEAQKPLEIAAERWPQGRVDAIERLVDIDLASERNDISSAMKRIEHWRTLPSGTPQDADRAEVKEMQAMLKARDFDAVLQRLDSFPADSDQLPQAQLLAAMAQRELCESAPDKAGREKRLLDALELHSLILQSPKSSRELRRRASLEQGTLLKLLGKLPDAISAFGILRMNSPQTPEGLMAGVQEIETLMEAGRIEETPSTMQQISSNLGDLKWYQADWLSLSNLRERLLEVGRQLIAGDHFLQAEGFIKALPAFAEEPDKIRLQSGLYEKWADSLASVSETRPQKLKLYRLAAHAYELLLDQLGRSPEYNDWLWSAISNYRNAERYQDSNRLVDRFLSLESRSNRPKGHLIRAQNLKSMLELDEAMRSLQRILDTAEPSLLIYEARLELAKIKASKNQPEEAIALLNDCMNGELRPETRVWQDALRTAAVLTCDQAEKSLSQAKEAVERDPSQLLHRSRELTEGHQSLLEGMSLLEEFQMRYPTAPDRSDLQYRLAKAYELAAYWPGKQSQEGLAATQAELLELEQQSDRMQTKAMEAYSDLSQQLMRLETESPSILLRNSMFGEANLQFQNENYSGASELYSEVATRFRDKPEAIEARKQLALCQRKLGLNDESLRTVQLALEQLNAIPATEEERFTRITSHDRQGWERYLSTLRDMWLGEGGKQ